MSFILQDVIVPKITIDAFLPKSGQTNEVVVIAFYAVDKSPAEDLNYFLQRSALDLIDIEVSPNPDEDGNYVVFVEIERNQTSVEVLSLLIKEVEHITGKLDWMVKPYLAKKWYSFEDPTFLRYFSPSKKVYEDVSEFLSQSNISKVRILKHTIVFEESISANIKEFGEVDNLKVYQTLNERKLQTINKSREACILESYLGDSYGVMQVDDDVLVYDNDKSAILLGDITFSHGYRSGLQ